MLHPSDAAKEFAVDVVKKLRDAGYQSLWAGGCVRDAALAREPKDYDVATSATPDQIRDVFGHRRTLAMGAAFGVITVLGRRDQGQIEVATFRNDGGYSDGRHPDAVTFSTAEEDAQRRDFTINGLFFDPLSEEIIDYVGGQEDLKRRVVRAIGDPSARISEDKLRMLRAVRFAATFGFSLDPATMAAVQTHASEIAVVSAERIGAELRRMLVHPSRRRAVELLAESGLLAEILPESQETEPDAWEGTLALLDGLTDPTFAIALAALLRSTGDPKLSQADLLQQIVKRWKLTNDEHRVARRLLAEEAVIRDASQLPWPHLQRMLIAPDTDQLLSYAGAVADVTQQGVDAVKFCQAKLALPMEELNPPPLLTGDDLKELGFQPGPDFGPLLTAIRDAQLEQQIGTRNEAIALVKSLRKD